MRDSGGGIAFLTFLWPGNLWTVTHLLWVQALLKRVDSYQDVIFLSKNFQEKMVEFITLAWQYDLNLTSLKKIINLKIESLGQNCQESYTCQ